MRIVGIAVQMTSSRELPWIGSAVAGVVVAAAEVHDRHEQDRDDEGEDVSREDREHVVERVDRPGLGGGVLGQPRNGQHQRRQRRADPERPEGDLYERVAHHLTVTSCSIPDWACPGTVQ